MFDRDIWQEIFNTIKKNKLRTFLTGFSVGWAIFILVMLLASVNGMQNGFYSQFNDDATNSIIIRPGTTSEAYAGFEAGRRVQFKNDDVEFIKQSLRKFLVQIFFICLFYISIILVSDIKLILKILFDIEVIRYC